MKIYLAGENGKTQFLLKQIWGGNMKTYLAGTEFLKNQGKENYVSILTGGGTDNENILGRESSLETRPGSGRTGGQILESFYYCRNNKWMPQIIPYLRGFLLDSGAFTFMQGAGTVDWDKYTEDYAEFINQWDIKLFFELDIDSIVGLAEVERLRAKLESLTGKKPIPVWHKNRGKEYFIKMCQDYPYVAFGGLMTDGIPRNLLEQYFPWFINTAHKYGAKIHCLGYTSIEGLHKYHFDSVDSSAWLFGNKSGHLYKFNPQAGVMDKIKVPEGKRLKSKEAAMFNYNEWTKFQEYAEKHL